MQFFESQRQARARTWRLLAGFGVTVALLTLALNGALALLWRNLSPWPDYPRYFFEVNTGLVLLFVLGGWWVETSRLSAGGAALALRVGAREASEEGDAQERQLIRIVQELSIASNLPVPQVFVLPGDASINAFAAGWDEADAVVAVTEGALAALDRTETTGLVAHELSHIREGDARLSMRLSGMVFGLEMIHSMGVSLAAADEWGRRGPGVLLGWVIQVLGWCGYLAGRCLMAAVMREREYLADARSVQYTRSRDGIGGVLRKVLTLESGGQQGGNTVARHPAMAHMLLIPGVAGATAGWLATHPPLAERIRRIYGRPMPGLPLAGYSDTQPTHDLAHSGQLSARDSQRL